jgi:membrane-associated protease RseP (regulator of RpoE activity)
MAFAEYFAEHWATITFYALVVISLIVFRKKFDWQGKIIALRRFKFGIKWMEKVAKKHPERLKLLGYSFIGIGFIGMIFIFGYVFYSIYQLFFVPAAPASFSVVLPGVHVPGAAIFIPLWVLIPLFIVVAIHEAGHGLIAKAHKVPIKNTGIVFFGPLAGAFVEPDEKKLEKQSDVVKYSIFAAGPGMNFLTAGIGLLLLFLVLNPLTAMMVSPIGFSVGAVQDDYPAAMAGVVPGEIFTSVNGQEVLTSADLTKMLTCVSPGDEVLLSGYNSTRTIITVEHPQDETKGYLGILGAKTEFEVNEGIPFWVYKLTTGATQFIFWIVILSIGLGAFNLLPLGPVDGGQMIRLSLRRIHGEKKGKQYWAKIGWLLLILLLLLIFTPMVKALVLGA